MQSQTAHKKQLQVDLGKLLSNKTFVKVICAHALQGTVFTAYAVTEQWYVVNELQSSSWLGVVMMLTALPRLIFMLMGGALTDRFSKVKVMLFSNFSRIFMLIAAAILCSTGLFNIGMVILFAIVFGTLDAMFLPAATSLPSTVVEKELIVRVNAVQRMSFQVSMMLGGVIAASVIAVSSIQGSFLLIAGIILASSLFLMSLHNSGEKPATTGVEKSVLKDIGEGLTYVHGKKTILVFLLIFLMTNLLFVGPIGISIPLIVKNILSGDELTLSFYQSAWAGGLLVGSTLALLFNLKKKRLYRSLLFMIVQGLVMIVLAQISLVAIHLVLILIAAICASLISVPIISYVQENTEREMLGRVMGLLNMASIGILPMAYALVSVAMSSGVPTALILLICGLILAFLGLMILITKKDVRSAD